MTKFPPKPEDDLIGWITRDCSYDKVSKDVYHAVEALKGRGCGKFGLVGCCWGALIAMQAGADAAAFSAAAG
jgi:dienelactone hydrolase